MAALTVAIVEKSFPALGAASARQVLGRLDFTLRPGETVVLTGPSGCGKTTLLNIVAGLDSRFEGHIEMPEDTRIGYVFQEPRLLPWRTVEDNLRLVLRGEEAEIARRVGEVLAEVGLADAHHVYASRLSLGMARRVAIARAFVVRPSLLLLDEPFVSLDEPTAARLRRLLLDLLAAHRVTTLFVTHNLREAIMLADRIVFLSHPPARILAEVPVPLDRAARTEDAAIEAFRSRLGELPALLERGLAEPAP